MYVSVERLTRLLVVIGFDAANVGRLLGHEDGHQLTQTHLELSASLHGVWVGEWVGVKYIHVHVARWADELYSQWGASSWTAAHSQGRWSSAEGPCWHWQPAQDMYMF